MKMPSNSFAAALAAKEKQIGIWMSMCSNVAADVIAPAGYDWALVDMEHTANDYLSVLSQLQAFEGTSTTAIVRVEWNDTVAVKRLLDIGAQGLLFPMIGSVDEAEKAVAATRYPPHGVRGFSGATRANKYGRITDYLDRINDELPVLLQLETRAAIAQAEAIGAVDGVSGIFFGPADIAADIGKLGQPMDPAVWALVRPAAQKLIAQGVPVGTLVMDPAFATELLNDGFTFVACATDASLLARASDAVLTHVKDGLA
ncbi:HpcH/HpaI aldolase/citrate lyase family protein [Yoonia sp. SS1-5]|uniref:HpcH/HpaI aldolase/citrate lyase family protein n=1 Tax=Yoonia rhodophyticola TaxID=3137370 RepID=A0AAN0NM10_9RHOB